MKFLSLPGFSPYVTEDNTVNIDSTHIDEEGKASITV